MILDSSVLVAILLGEPDAPILGRALTNSERSAVSAATVLEAGIVAESRGGAVMSLQLDALLAQSETEIVPFTAEHARLAREGWRRFGKGNHPAALNLGDCFAYALARAFNAPLLFVGDDPGSGAGACFGQTDIAGAPY